METAAEAGLIEQLPTDEDEDDNFGLEIKMDQLLKEELNGGDGIDKVRSPRFGQIPLIWSNQNHKWFENWNPNVKLNLLKFLKVNDITGEDDSIAVDEDDEDVDLRFSLDIYNVDRVCIMNEALGQVS